MVYPKITSEEQCERYKEKRQSIANMGTLCINLHKKEINELNLRIIEWNCRNDDHNPVQIPDTTTKDHEANINEGPKLHLRKSKSKTE